MSKRETMTERLRRMNAERQAEETIAVAPKVEETPENIDKTAAPSPSTADPKAVIPKEEVRISEISNSNTRNSEASLGDPTSDVHPGQGGRGDFLKVTVTMDPEDFEAINAEMVRRKRAKEKGAQLSGCIREAIRFWRAAGMPRQG